MENILPGIFGSHPFGIMKFKKKNRSTFWTESLLEGGDTLNQYSEKKYLVIWREILSEFDRIGFFFTPSKCLPATGDNFSWFLIGEIFLPESEKNFIWNSEGIHPLVQKVILLGLAEKISPNLERSRLVSRRQFILQFGENLSRN